jgi:hypothetical protein
MTDEDAAGSATANTTAFAKTPSRGLRPPVTLDGKPLLFMAVAGSALTANACPIAIAWTDGPKGPVASNVILPSADWMDKAWDLDHLADGSFSQQDLTTYGEPAARVANAAGAAIKGKLLVMLQPGLERLWLTELLVLRGQDICFDTTSLTSLALKLAAHVGLSDDAFVKLVAKRWFKLLMRQPTTIWTTGAPQLIQMLLDEAIRRKLIDPARAIRLKSRPRPRRRTFKRGRS